MELFSEDTSLIIYVWECDIVNYPNGSFSCPHFNTYLTFFIAHTHTLTHTHTHTRSHTHSLAHAHARAYFSLSLSLLSLPPLIQLHCTPGQTVQQVIESEMPEISHSGYQVYQFPSRALLNPQKEASVLQDQEISIEPMRHSSPGK